jgi:hypothetical protein
VTRTFTWQGDGIRWSLHRREVDLLRQLVADLTAAIDERGSPQDAVHARLFPPAVLGDAEADAEVRDLIGDALLADRLAALQEVVALLDRGRSQRSRVVTDLVEDEPLQVLTVLNDIRLAIGARIDVEAIDRDRVAEGDDVAMPLALMDHLGWWQEQLLELLDGRG